MNDNNNYNTTIDDMVQLLILEKDKEKKCKQPSTITPEPLRASVLFYLRVSPKATTRASNPCTVMHVTPKGRRDAEVAEVAEP